MKVEVGLRVVVHKDLEHFLYRVRRGTLGTVTFINEERGLCSVQMDELDDDSNIWNNEVYFNLADAEMPHDEWEYLQEVAWPLPTRVGYQ